MPMSHARRGCKHIPLSALCSQEEAQARFWAAAQSEQKHFTASFLLAGGIDKPQEKTHLHFRWGALRRAVCHSFSPWWSAHAAPRWLSN